MSSLPVRIISAFIGLGLLFGSYYFFKSWGWIAVCFFAALAICREFVKMNLPHGYVSRLLQVTFVLSNLLSLTVFVFAESFALPVFAVCQVGFSSLVLLYARNPQFSLDKALQIILKGTLGIFYCSILPGFVTKLLFLPHGSHWFFAFIFIIFSVDVWALFGGMAFGKAKLLETISPKKTIAGAISGLISGTSFGLLAALFLLPHISPFLLMPAAFFAALCSQTGDLFVSLMKRLAHVKDSGTIMPGHGGLMDRADGVYFAAPIFYVFAFWSTTFA